MTVTILLTSTFTSMGFQYSERIGSVAETSTGTSAISSVAGGPYAITTTRTAGGSFTVDNYDISYLPGGFLTILSAPLISEQAETPVVTPSSKQLITGPVETPSNSDIVIHRPRNQDSN